MAVAESGPGNGMLDARLRPVRTSVLTWARGSISGLIAAVPVNDRAARPWGGPRTDPWAALAQGAADTARQGAMTLGGLPASWQADAGSLPESHANAPAPDRWRNRSLTLVRCNYVTVRGFLCISARYRAARSATCSLADTSGTSGIGYAWDRLDVSDSSQSLGPPGSEAAAEAFPAPIVDGRSRWSIDLRRIPSSP